MFAKKKDTSVHLAMAPLPQAAPAPLAAQAAPAPAAPPPRPRPASMIAQGVTIHGNVLGDGELHLDCVVVGDIRVGKLILGPNARVEGAVAAQAIEVHGVVKGAVTGQAVRLYGTARVEGDITHEQLAMESGADFQGRSLKFQRQAPAAQPAAAPVAAPPVAAPSTFNIIQA